MMAPRPSDTVLVSLKMFGRPGRALRLRELAEIRLFDPWAVTSFFCQWRSQCGGWRIPVVAAAKRWLESVSV